MVVFFLLVFKNFDIFNQVRTEAGMQQQSYGHWEAGGQAITNSATRRRRTISKRRKLTGH